MTQSARQRRASRARCGVYDCSACQLHHQGACPGCSSGNLQLVRSQESPCPVFACVRELGVPGCYECTESPCRLDDALGARREWVRSHCPLRLRFGGEASLAGFREELRLAKGLASAPPEIPSPSPRSAERMHRYLQMLGEYAAKGVPVVSSHHLARAVGVRASLVRRDLARLGHVGKRGGGYQVAALREAIRRRLRLAEEHRVIWLGAAALKSCPEVEQVLARLQCRLVGVFDSARQWMAREVAGLPVQPTAKMVKQVGQHSATLAIVADKEIASQELVQRLGRAGVKAILNLTETPLRASAGAVVEQADLGSQVLRLLSRLDATQE